VGAGVSLECKLSTCNEGRRISLGPTLLDTRLRQAAGSGGSLSDYGAACCCSPPAPIAASARPSPCSLPCLPRSPQPSTPCVQPAELGSTDTQQQLQPQQQQCQHLPLSPAPQNPGRQQQQQQLPPKHRLHLRSAAPAGKSQHGTLSTQHAAHRQPKQPPALHMHPGPCTLQRACSAGSTDENAVEGV